MVATRCPALSRATAICMAVVDLPEPPFSLPSTITCAERGTPLVAWSNITQPLDAPYSGCICLKVNRNCNADLGALVNRAHGARPAFHTAGECPRFRRHN